MPAKVGVVLSGCGVFDGSEIHEAVSTLIALDRAGAEAICMAPAGNQFSTVDHLTKNTTAESRDILRESARIARGKIRDMADVNADELDALIFPGGYGAAKNLSTFASDGAHCKVNDQVKRLVLEMHAAAKPIGWACISPVVAAKIFAEAGIKVKLTIGTDADTAQAIEKMGAVHQQTTPTGIIIDAENHLVSTPCYMNDVGPWTVFQGVENMVRQVLNLIESRPNAGRLENAARG
jgi:enhancing lycopene biosynthesis protein 2